MAGERPRVREPLDPACPVTSDTTIGPEHLDRSIDTPLAATPVPIAELHDLLDFCEREIIRRVPERHGDNRVLTARALGGSR